jgi:hypothetical protein
VAVLIVYPHLVVRPTRTSSFGLRPAFRRTWNVSVLSTIASAESFGPEAVRPAQVEPREVICDLEMLGRNIPVILYPSYASSPGSEPKLVAAAYEP